MENSETPLLDKFNEGKYSRTPSDDKSVKILFAVMDDLTDRGGLDGEWSNIDAETQEEILQTNLKQIRQIMA